MENYLTNITPTNKQVPVISTKSIKNKLPDSDIKFTMDALTVLMNLLKIIEESQLNYSMSRTPFSATISLKCSFLKRFSERSNISSIRNMMPKPNLLIDRHVEQLEAVKIQEEVEKLKTTVENDQKNNMEELVNFI